MKTLDKTRSNKWKSAFESWNIRRFCKRVNHGNFQVPPTPNERNVIRYPQFHLTSHQPYKSILKDRFNHLIGFLCQYWRMTLQVDLRGQPIRLHSRRY